MEAEQKEVRKTVILPTDLDDWVAEQAKAHDRSYAGQLRMIIREHKSSREASVSVHA